MSSDTRKAQSEKVHSGWNTRENMRAEEAAHYIGISSSTLAKLRMRHKRTSGPRFLKLAGCVVYRKIDLDAWMESHAVASELL